LRNGAIALPWLYTDLDGLRVANDGAGDEKLSRRCASQTATGSGRREFRVVWQSIRLIAIGTCSRG
jgi:hypothetical protein